MLEKLVSVEGLVALGAGIGAVGLTIVRFLPFWRWSMRKPNVDLELENRLGKIEQTLAAHADTHDALLHNQGQLEESLDELRNKVAGDIGKLYQVLLTRREEAEAAISIAKRIQEQLHLQDVGTLTEVPILRKIRDEK